MTISVIVPTYRRVADLKRCLEAVQKQQRAADQVVLAVRDTDAETRAFLAARPDEALPVEVVCVMVPGFINALNAALAVAAGDVIALTDDDAAPWPDWLAQIERHFESDPKLGGVGGRDWQYRPGDPDHGLAQRPGELQWWGRIIGGHHDAAPGPPREVATLKGVNMAYRAAALKAIGFDSRLIGNGVQMHSELGVGLAMRRAGWKIVFDPAIAVDHFPSLRVDGDQRGWFSSFEGIAERNSVANETLLLFEHFRGIQRWVFLLWAFLIGTSSAPGMAQIPRLLLRRKPHALSLWRATLSGRFRGLAIYRQTRHR